MTESKAIKVGMITEAGGAHQDNYFASLASCPGVQEVALADPSGLAFEKAARFFSSSSIKLRTFKDPTEMLTTVKPVLALVTLEAHHAPRLIKLALDWECWQKSLPVFEPKILQSSFEWPIPSTAT